MVLGRTLIDVLSYFNAQEQLGHHVAPLTDLLATGGRNLGPPPFKNT